MTDVKFLIAGLFISNGKCRHITRTMKCHELIFVKSGTLYIREEEREFAVSAGQYLILQRLREHGGTADYDKKLSFFWGHFECSDKEFDRLPKYGCAARGDYLMQYFTLLINEQKHPDNQVTCNLLMKILLHETLRKSLPETLSAGVPLIADAARRIIDLNFASQVTCAGIAAELNCSADYLGKVFRKSFKMTILEYLNSKRCCEAAYLLESGDSSVKEIAFFSGYNDLPYFRKQFFRIYSVTPGQYRKMHRTGKVNTMNL